MSYRKYVRELEIQDITGEPTEYIPLLQQQQQNNKPNEELIIYIVISGCVLLIIFSIVYLKRYRNIF
jgi:hypothetical protein